MPDVIDPDISASLRSVVDHFEKIDMPTRERQIRHWQRLKLYWNNFSQIYWSESANDYRVYNNENQSPDDQGYYDRDRKSHV